MYHITKRSNIESILQHGLQPHDSSQWRGVKYSARVCLFSDLQDSLWNVLRILANKELVVRGEETHEDWTEQDTS